MYSSPIIDLKEKTKSVHLYSCYQSVLSSSVPQINIIRLGTLLFAIPASCTCFKCYPGAVRPESFQSKYLVSQALGLASRCLLLLDLKQFIFSNMVWYFLLKNTLESGPKGFSVVLQISYSTQHIFKNLVEGQCIFCFPWSIPHVKVRTFPGERSL